MWSSAAAKDSLRGSRRALPVIGLPALKVRGRKGLPPTLLAETQFALAKALHQSGEDRTRAQELARKARKTYETAGPAGASAAATIAEWLAAAGPEEPSGP